MQLKVRVKVRVRVTFNSQVLPSATYKRERGSQGVGNEQKFVRIGRSKSVAFDEIALEYRAYFRSLDIIHSIIIMQMRETELSSRFSETCDV